MTITVELTVTVRNTVGAIVPNAPVWAKLFVPDDYVDTSIPVGFEVRGVTNELGVAVLRVWPNGLSTEKTHYRVRGYDPVTLEKHVDVSVVVPNANCAIEDIAPPVPSSVSLSDVQVMISDAFASFINKFSAATEKVIDLGVIAGAQTLDLLYGQNFYFSMGGDVQITVINTPQSEPPTTIDTLTAIWLIVEQDALVGGHTLSFPGMIKRTPRGLPLSPNMAAGTRAHYLLMTVDSGQTWDVWLAGNDMA